MSSFNNISPIVVAVVKNGYDATSPNVKFFTNEVNVVNILPYDSSVNFSQYFTSIMDNSGNISENTFYNHFYNVNGNFCINQTIDKLSLNNLGNYVTQDGNYFNLYQQITQVYAKANNISVSSIDLASLILLQKECNRLQSITNFLGSSYNLSFSDLMNNLVKNNILTTVGEVVSVPLQITLIYYSCLLDTELNINIIYNVNMSLS